MVKPIGYEGKDLLNTPHFLLVILMALLYTELANYGWTSGTLVKPIVCPSKLPIDVCSVRQKITFDTFVAFQDVILSQAILFFVMSFVK